MSGTPIETKIRDEIDDLVSTQMVPANQYNFTMGSADFEVTVTADEEKNEDQGDLEKFEGLGIPENRRVMKAGLYRNLLPFKILVEFQNPPTDPDPDIEHAARLEYAAKAADDWKKAFGNHPQLSDSGAFESQYTGYTKLYDTGSPPKINGIEFRVAIRYRQRRKEPELAG